MNVQLFCVHMLALIGFSWAYYFSWFATEFITEITMFIDLGATCIRWSLSFVTCFFVHVYILYWDTPNVTKCLLFSCRYCWLCVSCYTSRLGKDKKNCKLHIIMFTIFFNGHYSGTFLIRTLRNKNTSTIRTTLWNRDTFWSIVSVQNYLWNELGHLLIKTLWPVPMVSTIETFHCIVNVLYQ